MRSSKDYEVLWTTNCTFYRNYKSSDPFNVYIKDTLKKPARPLSKETRIFGEIKHWSNVQKDYDVAWTRNGTFSTRRPLRTEIRIFGEIKLWSNVEKVYDVAWTRNSTFSTSKDYEKVWTTNCEFYRNYKSSDLLPMSLKKISNVYIKDTLKKGRRQLSKKCEFLAKLNFSVL
ncbi:hypothetical protein M0802_014956 [Mischocyttarus mexicanus]|nr:hypothetical protein M0802_014956 [Mischocyttarus mexicanus]